MAKFEPVRTVEDSKTLNIGHVIEGYWEGLKGEPEPGDNRGRAVWHGWRCGMMDSNRMPKDEAAAALAHDFVTRREGETP